jgi:next to BRCA1 gene 1 protein
MYGVAGGEEVDVAVDFLAPAKPGRYASYWRLASPSGKKFGQHIWVLIEVTNLLLFASVHASYIHLLFISVLNGVQVEEPIQMSVNKLPAINLNLPPAAKSTALKPLIDTNSVPRDPLSQHPPNIYNEIISHYHDSESEPDSPTAPNFQHINYGETSEPFQKPIILKESEPASSTLSSIPAAVKHVQIPTTDHHASASGPALKSMASSVSAPETIPLPNSAPIVAAPARLPAHTPTTSIPTSALPDETINKEEKLLREMAELGFGQVDLNREMLRRNHYDLEESVRELCSLND